MAAPRVLYRRGDPPGTRAALSPHGDPGDTLLPDHLRNIRRLKKLRADAVDRILQLSSKQGEPAPLRPHRGQPLVPTRVPLADILALRPAHFWLRHHALPFDRMGRTALVLVADPAVLPLLQDALSAHFDQLLPVTAPAAVVEKHLRRQFEPRLTQAASQSVPKAQSCRAFRAERARPLAVAACALMMATLLVKPALVVTLLSAVALLCLLAFTALRLAGLCAMGLCAMGLCAMGLCAMGLRPPRPKPPPASGLHATPMISMLVPLYREAEIGRHLLRRLCRLSYPRDRLEVLLVVEAEDQITQNAIRLADLPRWFRVVEVPPDGPLKTKPRAMNYALNFCKGDIIGVWDAEDAPAPHQLHRVVQTFAAAPPDVVCLQGVLDFYNWDHNWISRCFTLEYAGWFRILMPGLEQLRLVLPLGGTTMFIRRHALEQLGAWDAHNVTEDADLGVRIARRGLRTAMVDVATYEEANSQVVPWIKQRSRWLKGFMMTYLAHMRNPRALWRDLGAWRFFGVQAFFLGTVGQSLMAPFLWGFWLIALGLGHPAQAIVPAAALHLAVTSLILFEAISLAIWIAGARAAERAPLIWSAPLMPFYFLMGCAAAFKALYEIFAAPFFWDKTIHGDHGGAQ